MTDTKQLTGAAHLTTDDFDSTILGTNQPVMVDFFAYWCGPCQIAAPIIDKLAKEYAGKAMITKLDVDENHDVAQRFGVMSIPTVIMFQKNAKGEIEELDRQIGFAGEDGYRQMLEKAIKA